jgi:RNA polymerase sigma factor (sigma-70 family)
VNDRTDQQLLREYAERGSEEAFAELTRRYVDFVYSSALRMTCQTQLAEDVAQGVFLALAQNARSLADRPILAGWLHRTAQNLAAKTVRTEVRRRAREEEAATMNAPQEENSAWETLSPQLDAALEKLKETDRDVVFLKFFQQKSAREIGHALGVTEDAAQKRADRALERLREILSAQGATLSVGAIAGSLAAHAIHTAPAGLVSNITATAAATKTGLTLVAATKTLIMTKTQIALITTAVLLTAGIAPIVWLHQTNQASPATWKQRLDSAYALASNEVVKWIAPKDYPVARQKYYETDSMFEIQRTAIADAPDDLLFHYQTNGLAMKGYTYGGEQGLRLDFILTTYAGLHNYELDGAASLLTLQVPGDWVIREGTSREDLLTAIIPILSKATGHELQLVQSKEARPVLIASGKWSPGAHEIAIYAVDPHGPDMGFEQGSAENFFARLGDTVETRVIGEISGDAPASLTWTSHVDARDTGEIDGDALTDFVAARKKRIADKNEKILQNAATQTGLRFDHETRPVDTWVLSETK